MRRKKQAAQVVSAMPIPVANATNFTLNSTVEAGIEISRASEKAATALPGATRIVETSGCLRGVEDLEESIFIDFCLELRLNIFGTLAHKRDQAHVHLATFKGASPYGKVLFDKASGISQTLGTFYILSKVARENNWPANGTNEDSQFLAAGAKPFLPRRGTKVA